MAFGKATDIPTINPAAYKPGLLSNILGSTKPSRAGEGISSYHNSSVRQLIEYLKDRPEGIELCTSEDYHGPINRNGKTYKINESRLNCDLKITYENGELKILSIKEIYWQDFGPRDLFDWRDTTTCEVTIDEKGLKDAYFSRINDSTHKTTRITATRTDEGLTAQYHFNSSGYNIWTGKNTETTKDIAMPPNTCASMVEKLIESCAKYTRNLPVTPKTPTYTVTSDEMADISIKTEVISKIAAALKGLTFVKGYSWAPGEGGEFFHTTTRISQKQNNDFFDGITSLGIDYNGQKHLVTMPYSYSTHPTMSHYDKQRALIGEKGELAIHESIVDELGKLGLKLKTNSKEVAPSVAGLGS